MQANLALRFSILDIRLKPFDNHTMARVVLEQLTKIFQSRNGASIRAVDDMSLVIEDKELLTIVGPSGCGKTTLLRLISGLEEPTCGTIAMDGATLNAIPARNRDVAMVFQNPALYPHMSAYENMAFGLKLRKHSKGDIARRVQEAADLLGLTDCLPRKPMELSGGERQRVALGRAIVRRPKLFLFDEPLSSLDSQLRLQMRREISALHKQLQATILYVTHDQFEAMTLGQRVAVLNHGRVHQTGEPREIYNRPAERFVAGFIGSPAMNFFRGTIERREQKIYFLACGASAPDAAEAVVLSVENNRVATALQNWLGKNVVIGIRPEHIEVERDKSQSQPTPAMSATLRSIERLGPESYLRLATPGGNEFTVRVPGDFPLVTGKTLTVHFQMEQAHFFDPESGKRIE